MTDFYYKDPDEKWLFLILLMAVFCLGVVLLSGCANHEQVRSGYVQGSSNQIMWEALGHKDPDGRKRVVLVPKELVKELEPGMLVRFVRPNGDTIAHILDHRMEVWYVKGASNETGEIVEDEWITDVIFPLDENGEPIPDFRWKGDE